SAWPTGFRGGEKTLDLQILSPERFRGHLLARCSIASFHFLFITLIAPHQPLVASIEFLEAPFVHLANNPLLSVLGDSQHLFVHTYGPRWVEPPIPRNHGKI